MSAEKTQSVDDSGTNPEDVLWLAFANGKHNTVVRGPYTNKSTALESVTEFDDFHVEPRVPRDYSEGPCVPGKD